MYLLQIDEVERILAQAKTAFPLEASGLLLRQAFRRFTILSVIETSIEENTLSSFRIRDAEISKIAKSVENSEKKICGCFHSHVLGPARPSRRDSLPDKERGDLWLIYSLSFRDLNLFRWDGSKFQRDRFQIVR